MMTTVRSHSDVSSPAIHSTISSCNSIPATAPSSQKHDHRTTAMIRIIPEQQPTQPLEMLRIGTMDGGITEGGISSVQVSDERVDDGR